MRGMRGREIGGVTPDLEGDHVLGDPKFGCL